MTLPSFHAGKPKLVTVDGVANDTTIELQPDSGYMWLVIWAQGYHDDGANPTLTWAYYDGTNTVPVQTSDIGAISTAENMPLGATMQEGSVISNCFTAPAYIDNTVYLRLSASALAAGKKIFIRAMVLEFAQ